jgi:hypothetical protein
MKGFLFRSTVDALGEEFAYFKIVRESVFFFQHYHLCDKPIIGEKRYARIPHFHTGII